MGTQEGRRVLMNPLSFRHRALQHGFTIIELVVTVALVAILLRLAVPSFTVWIRNAQMRSVAEALQNGIRTAQSEAVRRNRQMVFALTNDVPAVDATAGDNGRNWFIRTIPAVAGEAPEFVEGGSFGETSRDVAIAGTAEICFNSQGRLVSNTTGGLACDAAATAYDVTQAGAERRLRVMVALGGQLRMCDPAKDIANAPDGCP
jgi:type IV fimbrial biogenesis protein FimT